MKNYFLITGLLLTTFVGCNKTTEPTNKIISKPNKTKSAIIEKSNSFACDIFKEINSTENSTENIFISPLSMYYALAMAGTGAEGETKDEFNELLGWQNLSNEQILESVKELTEDLKPKSDNISVLIANSLWQNEGFPIKEAYKSQTKSFFDAEVRKLNFGNPETLEIINSWIEVKTNNLIVDMLDYIPSDAVMYLINAIYFKGNWKYEFNEENSYDGNFANNIACRYMKQKSNFEYLSKPDFQAIRLPYTDSNFYMTIYLPYNEKTTDDIVAQLNTTNLLEWDNEYNFSEVELTMPKFNFEYGVNTKKELIDLGLEKAFTPQANFGLISDYNINISRVLHKAVIEVNEKGSEAAAATIVEIVYNSVDTPTFIADKPFIFTITHKQTNTILFMGKLTNPS